MNLIKKLFRNGTPNVGGNNFHSLKPQQTNTLIKSLQPDNVNNTNK